MSLTVQHPNLVISFFFFSSVTVTRLCLDHYLSDAGSTVLGNRTCNFCSFSACLQKRELDQCTRVRKYKEMLATVV